MEESATVKIQEVVNLEEYPESQREAYILEEPEANVNGNSEIKWESNSLNGNESQNGEVDTEANGSIGSELQDRLLANEITEMLESLEPPLSLRCCIYRIPHDIRKMNEEAYTPTLLSIGPFHHGDKRLKTMEKLKMKYLKRFVQKAALNMEDLVSYIRGREGDVRNYYAETSGLSSNNYVKMILVDASFIIVFFLMFEVEEWYTIDDYIVFTARLIATVKKDMWLLENQLPFFVIDELYNLAFASWSNYPSFTQLTFEFFANHNTRNMSPNSNLEIKHFVDLLRTFFLPPSERLPHRNKDQEVMHLYTVSQLHQAGIKFKVGSSKCLFDLKFMNGVLEIPCLKLFNQTESLLRNLMALEQCYYRSNGYVTDYFFVLDFLINTTKDVDLLVQKGILVNWLGDSNAVTTLVNNLCSQIMYGTVNSDYYKLCKDLNTFYEDPWHTWKATLNRDYFSTPWRIASTVAAIILLVLTFIQTKLIGSDPPFKVQGLWFFRGQEVPQFVIDECYDMELYDWKKVDIADEDQKERVNQMIEDHEPFEGVHLLDGKCFK